MNFPVTFTSDYFSLSAHFIFEILGFFFGYRYYVYLRRRQNDHIDNSNRLWIIIGAAFGAFLFSRLLGSLETPYGLTSAEHPLLYFFQNKTIVGALLGGLLCVELTKKIIKEKHSSGDLFTLPLILGMCIGRIGCFLNGVYEPTFGIETTLWTGLDLGDGLMRHPIALYEIGFLIVLGLLLSRMVKLNLKSGYIFKYFMIAYLIFRFAIDFIKPIHLIFESLSAIQIACLIGLLYYLPTMIKTIFQPSKIRMQ